jgi:hypothetical protein
MLLAELSNAQKMESLDYPIAALAFVWGVVCLANRKKQAARRLERVSKGELTEAESSKRGRLLTQGGYTLVAIGFGVAISHYLSN